MKPIPVRPLIPLLTDLLEYRQASDHTIEYADRMVRKYGDVCDVSFTGVRNYFIHDPAVIREMLTMQAPQFKRTYLFRAFRKFLGNGLFTSDGDLHRRQRKLIKPAFYPQRIQEYAEAMTACAEEETGQWKEGEKIQLNEAMMRITLQVIARTLFGSTLDRSATEATGRILREAFNSMNAIIRNPLYVYCLEKEIPIAPVRRFFRIRDELDAILAPILQKAKRGEETGGLLSMLVHAREDDGATMSEKQIRDEVMTFFIAGHETTSLALTWSLYLLARHPAVEQEVCEELAVVTAGRKLTASDTGSLQVLKNVFKESLRLYPPAWTFARESREDVTIGEYFFPKGSVLWTITYLMHHSEKYFDRPDEFIPSRWNDTSLNEAARYAYLPFGAGERTCIGEGFAWMEGVLVLATILSRFRLSLEDGFTTGVSPLFTLKPQKPIYMTANRRNFQA